MTPETKNMQTLREALKKLVVYLDGKWYTAKCVWTDVSEIVGDLLHEPVPNTTQQAEQAREPCGGREYCGRMPFCGCGAPPLFSERDPTKPAEEQGLFRKFDVCRVDGSDQPGGKHYGCRYFVLDLNHDQYAPAAIRAYAEACRPTHPQLSIDILAEFPTLSASPSDKTDAERYRWLRNVGSVKGAIDWAAIECAPQELDALDDAIDRMRDEKGGAA